MLGPPKARDLDRPVLITLESCVPEDHFYRHLHRVLDLAFVRDRVADRYAAGGRPSIDPEVFFRLQPIMFFAGIRSERQLLEQARYNLAMRWYAGYHLDEPLPDHSSLSKIRARLGLPVFRRFFEAITEQCVEAGLVRGDELLFDATRVRANAAMDSLVPRLRRVVDGHLLDVFGPDRADAALAEAPGAEEQRLPRLLHPPTTAVAEEPPGAPPGAGPAAGRWDLLDACRLDPARPPSDGDERTSDRQVSTTDPDAVAMKTRGALAALGYHDHYVIDGGKARIILYALVTPADVMENAPMLPMLRRAMFRWKLRPTQVVGDATYSTVDNIRELEEGGIRASVPLPDWEQRTPYFGSSLCTDDAARDSDRCPRGEPLRRETAKYTERVVVYRAATAACNACPLQAACTASDAGRIVHRSFDAAYLERVRGYHATAAYRKALRKRRVWIEPLFGEAKQWHGLRRFRLGGLRKVNMEGLFIAAGQNLKRLLSARGWGRRPWPDGAAGRAGVRPETSVIPI